MLDKLARRLSASKLAAIVAVVIFAPGALYAVAAFTNVVLIDPFTGYKARVDTFGRVSVYQPTADPYAYYKDGPYYLLDRQIVLGTSTCPVYTVPSGYNLVVTAITGWLQPTTSGGGGFYLTKGCGGGGFAGGATQSNQSLATSFGSGIPFFSGDQIGLDSRSLNATGIYLHGYLIPVSTFAGTSRPAIAQFGGARSTAKGGAAPP